MQRPHHANPRHHRRAAVLGDQHQHLDRGAPFRCIVLALWQARYQPLSGIEPPRGVPDLTFGAGIKLNARL
jgi:hypothetical protein